MLVQGTMLCARACLWDGLAVWCGLSHLTQQIEMHQQPCCTIGERVPCSGARACRRTNSPMVAGVTPSQQRVWSNTYERCMKGSAPQMPLSPLCSMQGVYGKKHMFVISFPAQSTAILQRIRGDSSGQTRTVWAQTVAATMTSRAAFSQVAGPATLPARTASARCVSLPRCFPAADFALCRRLGPQKLKWLYDECT